MTLGQNIQRLRKLRGLSQEQLSEMVGVTRQAISKWENDESLPDAAKLALLAQGLGVSADELLGLHTQEPPQDFSQEFESAAAAEERDLHGPLGWLIRQARKRGHYFGYMLILWGMIGFGMTRIFRLMVSTMASPFDRQSAGIFSAPILFADAIGYFCLFAVVAGIVTAIYLKRKNK